MVCTRDELLQLLDEASTDAARDYLRGVFAARLTLASFTGVPF